VPTTPHYNISCSDIDVAKAHTPKDISQLVGEIGLLPSEVELYGKKKAKVMLNILKRLSNRKNGRYVVVAGGVGGCLQDGTATVYLSVVCFFSLGKDNFFLHVER